MAIAGNDHHIRLAKLAYEETGRGVYEDKIIKNLFATEYIWHSIKYQKSVGVIEENEMAVSYTHLSSGTTVSAVCLCVRYAVQRFGYHEKAGIYG